LIRLRRAGDADAAMIAAIHRESRLKAMPWLKQLHTPAEDLFFFETSVLKTCAVWVAQRDAEVVGFCAAREGWVDHLYVRPDVFRQGAGKLLLDQAKVGQRSLYTWTFQRNAEARRFLEHYGFKVAELTDGQRNEEKEPDVLYLWQVGEAG